MRTASPFWTTKNFASDLANDFWKEMDQMFDRLPTPGLGTYDERNYTPPTEIQENEAHFLLSVDLPGMKREDIKIEVVDNTLTISGERKREQKTDNKNYTGFERHYGSFRRSFSLPNTINVNNIEASYESGVLELYLPKAEIAQPKKIEIQSGKGASFLGKFTGENKETNSPSATAK